MAQCTSQAALKPGRQAPLPLTTRIDIEFFSANPWIQARFLSCFSTLGLNYSRFASFQTTSNTNCWKFFIFSIVKKCSCFLLGWRRAAEHGELRRALQHSMVTQMWHYSWHEKAIVCYVYVCFICTCTSKLPLLAIWFLVRGFSTFIVFLSKILAHTNDRYFSQRKFSFFSNVHTELYPGSKVLWRWGVWLATGWILSLRCLERLILLDTQVWNLANNTGIT